MIYGCVNLIVKIIFKTKTMQTPLHELLNFTNELQKENFSPEIEKVRQKLISLIPPTVIEIVKRDNPRLCISCPICGDVFRSIALHKDFFDENAHEENSRVLKEIIYYAINGFDFKIYNDSNYKFNYCEHIKNK
jgi:hypothetical protein